jgi:hypothetical protein
MNIESLCILCLVLTLAVAIVLRVRRKDRLAAMTETELLEESFWAVQSGDYNNIFSREFERRQLQESPKERAIDEESISLHQP